MLILFAKKAAKNVNFRLILRLVQNKKGPHLFFEIDLK